LPQGTPGTTGATGTTETRPEEGWCCEDGNVFPATPQECERKGGHFFHTREEAEEHCRREEQPPPEPPEPTEPEDTMISDELYLPRPEYTLFSAAAMPLEYLEPREVQIETDEGIKKIKFMSVSPDELRKQDLDPPVKEYPEEVGIFEGDILFDAAEMKEGPVFPRREGENMSGGAGSMPFFLFSTGISGWQRLWPKRVVPYVIAPLAQKYDGGQILTAMSYWAKAGFKFRPRQPQDGNRYMYFMKISSWYSGNSDGIGMDPAGGTRIIRIGYHVSTGLITHEIGHGLGLFHEHTRSDRDKYVDIFWNNIKSDHYHDYCKYKVTTPTPYCAAQDRGGKDIGPYDFSSIMHYGSYTFGKISIKKIFLSGLKCILWPFDPDCYKSKSYVMRTMQKKGGATIVANDSSPSKFDIDALKELYKNADKCGGMLAGTKYGIVKFGGVNTFNHEVDHCTNRSYTAYTKDYRTLALTIDSTNVDIPAKDFKVRLTTPTPKGGVQIIDAYNPGGNKRRVIIYKNMLPGNQTLKISNWLYQKVKYKMSFKFTTTPVPKDAFDKANKGNSISNPVDLGTLSTSPFLSKTVSNVTIHLPGDIDYYTFLLPSLPAWAIEQYCDKSKGPNGAKIIPGRFIIQLERQDLHRTLRTVVYRYDSKGQIITDPLKAFRPWGWGTNPQTIKCPYKHFKNRRVIFSVEDCSDTAGHGKTNSAGKCSKAKRHYYSIRISFGFTAEEQIEKHLPDLRVLPPLLKHGPFPRYLTPMAVEFIINQGQFFMQLLPAELKTGYGFDRILDRDNKLTTDMLKTGNLNLLYKQYFNKQNQ
jgi:hypothetical protein